VNRHDGTDRPDTDRSDTDRLNPARPDPDRLDAGVSDDRVSAEAARIERFVTDSLDGIVSRIESIVRIPSPTGREGEKAAFVANCIRDLTGEDRVGIDAAGNVLYEYNPGGAQDALAAAAHIDTVFEDLDRITIERRGSRLYAPSAGDNSANVAGLLAALGYLTANRVVPDKAILFAFTTGEEGSGNLRGMRHLMETHGARIREAIAVDGTLESVMAEAVASRRYLVRVSAPGGHSWHDFGSANAVASAAEIVARIYRLTPPRAPRTTYNVGLFRGGTSVNSIAETAEFTLDLRSVDPAALAEFEREVIETIERYVGEQAGKRIEVTTEPAGERPGGKTDPGSPLVARVKRVRAACGLPLRFHASSTDANVPIGRGVPAVTFGVYRGDGAHTKREYIELDSLGVGLRNLILTLALS
jgi:tripeptide aminopeptidase